MIKAWKKPRRNVVKWGLCPDIQLTECEGVWPHTVSVGRQSGGDWPHGVRLCGGSGPHLVSQHVWGSWASRIPLVLLYFELLCKMKFRRKTGFLYVRK